MKICIKPQIDISLTLPLKPVRIYTGSALPLEIYGLPSKIAQGTVSAVTVTVTNANGTPVTGSAVHEGGQWNILFASSNYENYGHVGYGVKIVASVVNGETTYPVVVGVGDLEIAAASASAVAGDPTASYVTKGSDVYLKSYVADEVQHYVKMTVAYDARVGWGATWSGDYILNSDGEFVAA